ncbi:MAG: GIY-YIG nuclease family protein [Nostoc sp.]
MATKGIYLITNKLNGKVYVGASQNIESRWKTHKQNLNRNKHHSKLLQGAWNEHGEENFEFTVIHKCENLRTAEQELLNKYQSFDPEHGYNMSNISLISQTKTSRLTTWNTKMGSQFYEQEDEDEEDWMFMLYVTYNDSVALYKWLEIQEQKELSLAAGEFIDRGKLP